jgi:hypothetical protein
MVSTSTVLPITMRRRALKRLFVVLSISLLAALGLNTGVAGAAEPANQGCYGESISFLATNQPFPGAFGAGVVGFAQAPPDEFLPRPGLGDGVQALQAGVVPDEVVLNTCNP